MGISLGRPSGPPSVKLRAIGDYVDLAIVDVKEVVWTDFTTGKPKIGEDGRERTQDAVSAVVVRDGGGGVVSVNDADRPVAVDEVVSIYFAGHRRWDFVQAQKALEGGLNVGDIMRVKYDHDEPSKGGSPKKVWSIQIRHPRSEEQALLARCEKLHREGAAIPLTPNGGGNGGGSAAYNDEPF